MKAKILRTELIRLDPLQPPYHEIEIEHNKEIKVLYIDCYAWENRRKDIEKIIKKYWATLQSERKKYEKTQF